MISQINKLTNYKFKSFVVKFCSSCACSELSFAIDLSWHLFLTAFRSFTKNRLANIGLMISFNPVNQCFSEL